MQKGHKNIRASQTCCIKWRSSVIMSSLFYRFSLKNLKGSSRTFCQQLVQKINILRKMTVKTTGKNVKRKDETENKTRKGNETSSGKKLRKQNKPLDRHALKQHTNVKI